MRKSQITGPGGGPRRALRIGSLAALVALAGLAPAPAHAQIDVGFLPQAGTWAQVAPDTVAWIDLASWRLATEFAGGVPFADPSTQEWLPVAGDWDGDRVDTVLMFNVHTWELVPAESGPPAGAAAGPEPIPWLPVAGDWAGLGFDTVMIYDLRDESLHRIEEGPIPVEGYDPEPIPWLPYVGDWDGDGVDTLATAQAQETSPASAPVWTTVAGDWDGDGVSEIAALHLPTGELMIPEPEAIPRAASSPGVGSGLGLTAFGDAMQQLPNGCYWTIKNYVYKVLKFKYGVGGCMFVEMKMWERWTCCPIGPSGPFPPPVKCNVVLEGSTKTSGYSNC